ncbi:hypothetical protein V498_07806 [Pseudogymnoascus sp. VKM F-4517 (FW-2822)]|nr:hypothetical protein V498_07806 [Pseudogymnoascus sp. VKM F-4517 (FW-2822)]
MDTPLASTPNSEDDTSESRTRKRTTKAKACDSCYKKKIKCDATLPQCNWCKHHNLQCTFDRILPTNRKKRSQENRDTELAERIERIEKLLSEKSVPEESRHDNTKQSTAITTIGTRITPTVSSSLGNLHFAGFKVREVNSCNSIPLFLPEGQQWIKSRTGETVAMEKLYAFGPPWQNQRNTYMNDTQLPQDSVQLPDRRITEEFARGYSSHILSLVFPTIDKALFEDTISLAYHQGSFQPTGHASAKACVYAFLAFASVFNIYSKTGTRLPLESEAYALKAQSLIPQVFQDITTESLQTAVMLTIYQLFSGNQQSAAVMGSIASRLAFMLGAHTQHHSNIATQKSTNSLVAISTDLRLVMIKSRAYNSLYSAQALQKSDAELLKDIRELDDELEKWRISLPLGFRPTISYSHETPTESGMDMQKVVSRLAYHHCMATIHEASGRCRARADGQSTVMEGVSSSLELAVEASRSSFSYLHTAQHVLEDDCFWMILFYPMSALLTIFCNILHKPLDPQAAQDLELINRAPDLIKGMPIPQPNRNELFHINLVDEFIAELSRLGKCAISKAKEENLNHRSLGV